VTSSTRVLHTTRIAAENTSENQAARWLAMFHGIYGRGRNWQAIAKELARQRPDWGSLLVDLRLHGESPGYDPPHTLAAAADDVRDTIAALSIPMGGALGHSFGGKVALALAARRYVSGQIWVIDSTPEARTPSGSAWNMLTHVREMPETFAARADFISRLEQRGWPTGVAQWMSTNLRFDERDKQFRWSLDFDAMEALLRSFFDTDLWDVVEQPPDGVEIHFVKATESHTLTEDACARITRAAEADGRVHLHRLAGGHWLNADNPQGIIALLVAHLPRA
jgi:esterase